jgi:hypothetical protein
LDLLNTCSSNIVYDSRTEGANEKVDRTWKRWKSFLHAIHFDDDIFLDSVSPINRIHISKCFFQSLKSGSFQSGRKIISASNQRELLGRTVREAIGHLAEKFRSNNRPSPVHIPDNPNVLHYELRALIQSWKNTDRGVNREAALTPKHLRFIHKQATSRKDQVLLQQANLLIGAFFFACRSCEYSKVQNRGRTKLLNTSNIKIFNQKFQEINPTSPTAIITALTVSVTFESQKNGEKNVTRVQHRTSDPILCPVKAWLYVVSRIMNKNIQSDIPQTINKYWDHKNKVKYFSQNDTNTILRHTCTLCPHKHFGYTETEIGSHSLRSGAAMALFLAQESVHKIMILGRWSSDAFLDYIRPQVQEWTSGMSLSMVSINDYHTATHNMTSNQHIKPNCKRHQDDPCRRFDNRSISSSFSTDKRKSFNHNGPNATKTIQPHLHIFH